MRRNLNAIAVLKIIGTLIVLVLLAYFIASFIDVVSHNLTSCKYEDWNLFTKLLQLRERLG